MTIVNIVGGLGNQMFQYALAKSISQNGIEVKLDISNFENYNLHNGYRLNKLNVDLKTANKEEIIRLRGYEGIFRRVLNKINLDIKRPDSFIEEKLYMSYNDGVFRDNLYLKGYWQNEKYFKNIRKVLLKEFTPKEISNKAKEYLKIINENDSISIHIRRGDYLKLKHIYYICDKGYYLKVISLLKNKIKNPKFFIFSDNIDWCKNNLNIDAVYIENTNEIDDLYLMKNCEHNIISNSTFSWWGAWLNENEKKIVIGPKQWFVKKEWQDINLVCKEWIKG